jgi:hypothetical protein
MMMMKFNVGTVCLKSLAALSNNVRYSFDMSNVICSEYMCMVFLCQGLGDLDVDLDDGGQCCPCRLQLEGSVSDWVSTSQISSSSSAAVAAAVFLFDGMIGLSEMFVFFVQIQAEAYMFTLDQISIIHIKEVTATVGITHRSIHFPESRCPTHFASKPLCSKMFVYHGRSAAERNRTRPPSFSTLFSDTICSRAAPSASVGSNQSIESMSCGNN